MERVMARRWPLVIVLVFGVGVSARAVGAQTVGVTTGAISGTVTDPTGAVLPGVSVAISSDVQPVGRRRSITDLSGMYRFVALPPGEYGLELTRDGYRSVRRLAIVIASGEALTLDVSLDIAIVESTVLVEASPIVNPGATAVAAHFDARELAHVPMSRSMAGLLSAAAALEATRFDVAGNSGPAGGVQGAYGTFGGNRPMIEGISITNIAATGMPLNYGALDEAVVLTAAHGPEWPSSGVHMQLITKSGGDRHAGLLYADYQHRRWQARNIDPDQVSSIGSSITSRSANQLWASHDVNADLGGYLRRGAAWWYGSVRRQTIAARHVNFPVAPIELRLTNVTAKTTWQPTPNHRIVAFVLTGRNGQPFKTDAFAVPNALTVVNETAGSTTRQRSQGWVWKAEWNGSIADRWYVDARVGQFGVDRVERPNGSDPRVEDVVTAVVRGGNRHWEEGVRRTQLTASLSRFASGPAGTHQLKAGAELTRTVDSEYWRASYEGDVLHVVRDGVPSQVFLFSTPSLARNGLHWLTLHAGDSWRVHRRLTMNIGLRFDRYRIFLPAQQHPATGDPLHVFAPVSNLADWNVAAPRLGAAFDLTGRGRMFVKGSYGYYWFTPGAVGPNSNPNATEWWRLYSWHDADGSGIWEPGEEDASRLLGSRGGAPLESLDPDLKPSYTREATAWYEHQLASHLGLRTGVVWRTEHQPFMRQNVSWPLEAFSRPIAIPDPGPDGRLDSPDDGAAIQGFELDPALTTLAPRNEVRNVPVRGSAHLTWEIGARRRFANRWSLAATFAHMWSRDQASGYFGQAVRANQYPVTPNDFIHADRDGRYRFTTWTLKAHAMCEGPWGVHVSPLLRVQSGQPFGRTFSSSLNYGRVRILAEPIGTHRMPHVALLDLRMSKRVPVPGGRHARLFLDVFNVLNANPEQNANWSSGSAFLQPQVIVAPRVARIGVRIDW
jgi:hypothetical protein